ncbi:MAG: rhomboid family intramembrane serine protease, partial [Candidatus Electrothrix sp. AUS1_2]|nr:rhomboid family intramembrane serine protease [Candidatus Electrothrix sp. AUS1_2]
MLIIPVSKNFKKSFPYVTLTLIILNAMIFFGFQLGENQEYGEAISYYQSADLLDIEGPLYRK